MDIDDRDLATLLDTHLYDHRERNHDCVVCAVILAHHLEWRHQADVALSVLLAGDAHWATEYEVRVDERGWMVISHRGCDADGDGVVAEWPDAQGMWPLTYEHLLAEARIHNQEHHT